MWADDPAERSPSRSHLPRCYAALFEGARVAPGVLGDADSAAPLILAGLSVAIGFRAGLFNIGAEGQMLIGGLVAAIIGFTLALPTCLHCRSWPAPVGGAIWGGPRPAPSQDRRPRGHHHDHVQLDRDPPARLPPEDLVLPEAGRADPISKDIVQSACSRALRSRSPLRVHAGIIVAVLVAWFVYWLLFKSTIGYEFRAVGLNPDAARYGGMNVARAYTAVMAVAGALPVSPAPTVLGVLYRASPGFAAIGFDAIALALLGRSHPAGVVLAGLLFGALRAGGQQMQASGAVGIDLILVIQSLIIVFIAAPALIRAIYRVKTGRRRRRPSPRMGDMTAVPSPPPPRSCEPPPRCGAPGISAWSTSSWPCSCSGASAWVPKGTPSSGSRRRALRRRST